ncbi:hypothetical protein PROFUN_10085 [Planoprotostelium fungivorum]|uniref:Uncharacterized protein n=1 Tax=Planoprotostelium fungivorum TaxID=1890364 RepID=A0A2P6NF13_9EUKA|nr:hypothetical protein PROFUN_10085 [Planoprotostelium fungivorum]
MHEELPEVREMESSREEPTTSGLPISVGMMYPPFGGKSMVLGSLKVVKRSILTFKMDL